LCDDEIDDDFTDEQFLHPSQNTRRKPPPPTHSTHLYVENSRSNVSIDSVTTVAADEMTVVGGGNGGSGGETSSSYDSMCQISSFSDLRRRIRIRKEHYKQEESAINDETVKVIVPVAADESSLEATQLLFQPAEMDKVNGTKSINPSSLLVNKDEDQLEEDVEFDKDEEHDMPMYDYRSTHAPDRQLTSSDELVSPLAANDASISYLKSSLERRIAKHAWIEEEMAELQVKYAKLGLKRVRSANRIKRLKASLQLADRV
jgi:hypothetical protein